LEAPAVLPAKPKLQRSQEPPAPKKTKHTCPIPGCTKVFHHSRGGWDAHVASHRKHSDWYPDIKSPRVRKELFRRDFGDWFL